VSLVSRTGYIQQHNVSVQGGSKQTQFIVALNYYDQAGIIQNSDIKRFTGKIGLDHAINTHVKMGVNLIASRTDNNNAPLGAGADENSGLIRAALQMSPNIEAIDENGNYPVNPLQGTQPNPYSLLTITDQSRMDRFVGNAYVLVQPIEGLSIKLNAGSDIAYQGRNTYNPKTTVMGLKYGGYATISQKHNDQYLLEATANYLKTFNDIHRIGLLVGASEEKFVNNSHFMENTDFITDAFLWNNMGSGTGQFAKSTVSSGGENKMRSFFGRFNYTLKDRYLFTATFRADGASVFAENHKWGYFPSAAIA
jgi:hypothetical protein